MTQSKVIVFVERLRNEDQMTTCETHGTATDEMGRNNARNEGTSDISMSKRAQAMGKMEKRSSSQKYTDIASIRAILYSFLLLLFVVGGGKEGMYEQDCEKKRKIRAILRHGKCG